MRVRSPAGRPLSGMAVGLLLIVLDFRIRQLDLLADPAGWLLVALGAWDLRLRRAALAGGIAAAVSTVDLVLPYHYVRIDPATGEVIGRTTGEQVGTQGQLVWDHLSAGRAVAMATAAIVGGIALWATLGGLGTRAERAAATTPARRFRLLRVAVVVAWVVPYVAAVTEDLVRHGSFDPVWNDGRELLALPGAIALVCVAVALVLSRDEAWALRPEPSVRSPWGDRRLDPPGGRGQDP